MRSAALLLLCTLLAAGEATSTWPDYAPAVADGTRWVVGERVSLFIDHLNTPGKLSFRAHATANLAKARPDLALLVREWSGTMTAGQLLQLAKTEAAARTSSLVVLGGAQGEVADLAKAATADQYATTMKLALGTLKQAGIQAILATPGIASDATDPVLPANALLDGYTEAVRSLGRTEDIPVIDLRTPLLDHLKAANAGGADRGVLCTEPGQLNDAGQKLMAKAFVDGLAAAMRQLPWQVDLADDIITESTSIAIGVVRHPDPKRVQIRYTLNGKPADEKSTLYAKPFKVAQTTTVEVLATDPGDGSVRRARAVLTREKPRPAERAGKREPGLQWAWYPGKDHTLPPDLLKQSPSATGTASGLDLEATRRHPAGAATSERFVVQFAGFINIPFEGVYTFTVRGDDRVKLYIGDRPVCEGGWPLPGRGRIALDAGQHPFRVQYAQGSGGYSLEVLWQAEGSRLQPVPDLAFLHDPTAEPFKPLVEKPPAGK